MAQYGKKDYWEERYARDTEPFDWYQRYSGLRVVLEERIKKTDTILVTGCGNSRLSEEMFEAGFENISNIDYSSKVIHQMAEKNETPMEYTVMDVTALDFGSSYFDVVLDKGTLDSVSCGEGSTANIAKYMGEVSRVLKPNGVFVVISYGAPDHRLVHMEKPEYGWAVEVTSVPKPAIGNVRPGADGDDSSVHYIYTARKGRR